MRVVKICLGFDVDSFVFDIILLILFYLILFCLNGFFLNQVSWLMSFIWNILQSIWTRCVFVFAFILCKFILKLIGNLFWVWTSSFHTNVSERVQCEHCSTKVIIGLISTCEKYIVDANNKTLFVWIWINYQVSWKFLRYRFNTWSLWFITKQIHELKKPSVMIPTKVSYRPHISILWYAYEPVSSEVRPRLRLFLPWHRNDLSHYQMMCPL